MKRKRKSSNRKNSNNINPVGQRTNYEDIVPENADFEKYYKLQNICPDEEWNDFVKCLRSPLPSSFRITSSRSEAKAMLELIQGQYFKEVLNASREEGFEQIVPVAIPWYPDNLAWQLDLSKKDIRRSQALCRLHNFLISETESGYISRQEAVSMIPPVALDVQPHHKVLDMCAAPGSKTAQLIESLHKHDRMPEGFIIANDVSNNRCYMLVHQAKRLNSPNIIITNHDATAMPNFMVKTKDGAEEVLKFDRVLCDVPCSGDGTLRKNPAIWTSWKTSIGTTFHGLQFRIAKRGCEMLKVNGRLVYSTCSLNPVENEAVIMRLLTEAKGSLKLIDLSSSFPGLKFMKGRSSWIVASKDVNCYKSFDEVPNEQRSVLRPEMFPPGEEKASEFHIDRCIRILPHYQDTGGFFIAALEKVDKLPWESLREKFEPEMTDEASKTENSEPKKKKRKIHGFREDPFVFFSDEEPLMKEFRNFYELSNDLPGNCLLTRCKNGKKKNIYLTSPQVREIIIGNENKINIINSGVKAFARCDNKGMIFPFRLAQEGLPSIFPYIGEKRKVRVTKQDLLMIFNNEDLTKPPEIFRFHPDTQKKIRTIGGGSCVLIYTEEPVTESSLNLELVGWIGSMSVRSSTSFWDSMHYLRLLGGDTSKFDEKRFKRATSKEETKEESDKNEIVSSQ